MLKAASVALCLLVATASSVVAQTQQPGAGGGIASTVANRSFFYAGGQYVGEPGKQVMAGQMYVERLAPREVRQPFPIVLIHGAAQTATNWMQTPDGRKGWAEYFIEQGYVVYMVDQPARGRSVWHPDINGKLRMFTVEQIETLFTASQTLGKWPQAKLHTQWPGTGKKGDPVFDAFYATQVESLLSDVETQTLVKAAGGAMLDRIGPAILLTHSQAGLLGWVIAEARPNLVKAIVALEPSGPPFHNNAPNDPKARAYGISDLPLAYDPPIASADELVVERQAAPDGEGLITCTLQKGTPRKLVALSKIPVLLAVSESSYHAPYDHCTAAYMKQAGVPLEFVRLKDHGIKGNGHMMMIEKNNLEVAGFMAGWLGKTIKP
ncbi:MAG: alpha/beta fold hydrolase [Proteobacteria bacterium]|nr:alpha/beta fold hydrolase [Pseudomonadota bacterium]